MRAYYILSARCSAKDELMITRSSLWKNAYSKMIHSSLKFTKRIARSKTWTASSNNCSFLSRMSDRRMRTSVPTMMMTSYKKSNHRAQCNLWTNRIQIWIRDRPSSDCDFHIWLFFIKMATNYCFLIIQISIKIVF